MEEGIRRSNIKIASKAVVCEESILKGDISIGPKCVIHPRAMILAEAGPIIIGEGNIVEEMATIVNRLPPGENMTNTTPVQIIGNYNVFEVYSTCEAIEVGDHNILETRAHVGRNVELSTGCIVGASCSLTEPETIPENTIIYGSKNHRRDMSDKPSAQLGQIDFLSRVLPNYHHLHKPNIKFSRQDSTAMSVTNFSPIPKPRENLYQTTFDQATFE